MRHLLIAAWLLVASSAFALTPNNLITCQTPKSAIVTFVQGTDAALTYKTIYAGAASGSKIMGLWATSTDGSVAHLVTVQISSSSSNHCATLGTCAPAVAATVPVSSGFANGAPAVNLLSAVVFPGLPSDNDSNAFFFLPSASYTVEATFTTALTASTEIAITIVLCDFA